jgi:sporulation protein YlmC with PRC-barrel domain
VGIVGIGKPQILFLAVAVCAAQVAPSSVLAQRGAPQVGPQPEAQASERARSPNVGDAAPSRFPGTELTSEWDASRLIGAPVTTTLDESIGTVKDVVLDGDGKLVAVTVGVGGFLGLGETPIPIELRHLVIAPSDTDPDRIEVKTSLSKNAIDKAATLDPAESNPTVDPSDKGQ